MIGFRDSRIYVRDKKTGKVEFYNLKGTDLNRCEIEEKLKADGKIFMYGLYVYKRKLKKNIISPWFLKKNHYNEDV